MSEQAKKIIGEGAYTPPEVIAEVVYVLKGVYKIGRNEIADTLKEFMEEISVENQEVVYEALTVYSEKALDFVDCLLLARNKLYSEKIATFDKKLNKLLIQQ